LTDDQLAAGRHAEPVAIVGAGGLGQEVLDAVVVAGRPVSGFLDDEAEEAFGPAQPEAVPAGASVIVALGDPVVRSEILQRFAGFDRWATVVHPSAVVSSRSRLAHGVFVGALAYVGPLARVGTHVVVNVHAEVGHHVTVGPLATLSPMVALNGGVTIGDGVFLGTGASVEPGVTIGAWSRVAAGAHITRDCAACHLLAGNPAKGRRMFEPPEPSSSAPVDW